MSYIEKEKLIKADILSIENRVRHAFNQGYDLGIKDGKERAKPQEQEPCDKYIKEIDHLRKYIYKLETQIVEQEPRKGHWIPVRVDRYSEQYGHFKINEYKCSNCNSEFEYGYHNYCPYCGAKMVDPQESEDKE